jgi:nucleotide-binding universal stress UspA family protein
MTGVAKISRVLVGVDFDEASAAALKMAASLAFAWEAELTVFHAATEAVPAYFTASQIGQLEVEREQGRAAVAGQLRTFAEREVPGGLNVVVGDGPPQDAIVRVAPAFDLIAVGTHRRHGPRRWWLGSVAEAVVRQSPRPVLVVPAGASVLDTRSAPIILAASEDGAAADAWVNLLRSTFGGSVVRSPDIHQCAPDRLQRADLVVLSLFADTQLNAIAHVLKECVHPVLFVPSAEGIGEDTALTALR